MDRIASAIVIAAVILGAAHYFKPQPQQPRYQMEMESGARLDTFTGEIVLCHVEEGCRGFAPEVTQKGRVGRVRIR